MACRQNGLNIVKLVPKRQCFFDNGIVLTPYNMYTEQVYTNVCSHIRVNG